MLTFEENIEPFIKTSFAFYAISPILFFFELRILFQQECKAIRTLLFFAVWSKMSKALENHAN